MSGFGKVLVANRGEIACRILGTLRRLGIGSVAIHSDADRHAMHVRLADRAVRIGPAPAAESYLDTHAIIEACRAEGVDAVHPGYGFLSENAAFAEALSAESITFIGPKAEHIRLFGQKHTARDAARAAGVPLLPGTGLITSAEEAVASADAIGFPLMVKSTAGGGGIGLQLCRTAAELPDLVERVRRLGQANFGDGGLFLEAFVEHARHVEVQIFGDGAGRVLALGERDCSLQRRNQKILEETPAPGIPPVARAALLETAAQLGRSVGYASAGTVEFVYDGARDEFFCLEVNTRLQVEHPVTEAVIGVDLVEWMVRTAEGAFVLPDAPPPASGHAIEVRVYAEDPAQDFRPSAGRVTAATFPAGVRVDTWIDAGTDVPSAYDPLLAKIIVHGTDRAEAIRSLQKGLAATDIYGIATNLDYLRQIAGSPMLADAAISTRALERFSYAPSTVAVIAGGTQSTLQDWPGRLGFWHVGVPPSGPMDCLSHRLANRIAGNPPEAAALEMTFMGPALRFGAAATVAIVGADMKPLLDGVPVAHDAAVSVPAGATLAFGTAAGPGLRATLAVRGGFEAPEVLGSRATFMLGGFGGHATGAIKAGDVLRIGRMAAEAGGRPAACGVPLTDSWTLGVLYGPHGAPDFFTDEDVATLLSSDYAVQVNSARTGVRLDGPKPRWARPDGGEAGLHPSNIHDTPYAVGAVDFTGDMPILLGPDGPSLGGFVCPFVLAKAERWKLGQLRPGDTVRFVALALAEAEAIEEQQEAAIASLATPAAPAVVRTADALEPAVRLRCPDRPVAVVYRRQGQDNLLVEFGDNVLDLSLRVRAHVLMERIAAERIDALVDITPGIRSLQLRYDNRRMSEAALLDRIDGIERELGDTADALVPSRIVHLPLAFDDSQTRLAAERYQSNVRADAPWCPSNLEFIRRINGLSTVDDVRDVILAAEYVVYGLGDVYLGAPVATPLDPRHRLVTTKYNPARTWTPENAVGIGGAYLCIYGMEGPGGYQFVGRTVQVWSTYRQAGPFRDGCPWLLRYFDRIRFHPVEEAELLELREAFPHGAVEIAVEDGEISLAEHRAAVARDTAGIAAFRARREAAFDDERRRWDESGLGGTFDDAAPAATTAILVDDGTRPVDAPLSGIVWTILVRSGDRVAAGDVVAVLEAMKMEVPITATAAGRVDRILATPGHTIAAGAPILTLAET